MFFTSSVCCRLVLEEEEEVAFHSLLQGENQCLVLLWVICVGMDADFVISLQDRGSGVKGEGWRWNECGPR